MDGIELLYLNCRKPGDRKGLAECMPQWECLWSKRTSEMYWGTDMLLVENASLGWFVCFMRGGKMRGNSFSIEIKLKEKVIQLGESRREQSWWEEYRESILLCIANFNVFRNQINGCKKLMLLELHLQQENSVVLPF